MNGAVSDVAVQHDAARSRTFWWPIEPINAVARFAPEVIEATARMGLHDPVAAHLITRLSSLAPLPPRVRLVAAGWHVGPTLERMVLRRGDDVRPETLRTVQLHALDQAFWRIYGTELIRSDHLVSASQLARRAAELADCRGRALAAAQQCLEWPTFPHLVLWQASAILSEHRAFGRRAVLMAESLTPLQGHILDVAAGVGDIESIRLSHAIMRPAWSTAESLLADRGLLDEEGALTSRGRNLYASIDSRTDRAADQPLAALGDADASTLIDLLAPFTRAVIETGDLGSLQTMCLPDPSVAMGPKRQLATNLGAPTPARVSCALAPRRPGLGRAERFRAGRPRQQRRRPAART